MFSDILIIKPEWCDAILCEGKCWEIRGQSTKKRGIIGLAKTGTGKVYGECNIIDCIALDRNLFETNRVNHHLPYTWEQLLKMFPKPYAWVLKDEDSKLYDEPLPFDYPKGAVAWVKYKGDATDS